MPEPPLFRDAEHLAAALGMYHSLEPAAFRVLPFFPTAETDEKSNFWKFGKRCVGASVIHSTCSKHKGRSPLTFWDADRR